MPLDHPYGWIVFIHLIGVFGFLLAHGVSTAVAFRLRRERDRTRIATLSELSGSSLNLFWWSLGLLLIAGIVGGFTPGLPGSWWGAGWIWTALVLLVLTVAVMTMMARPYYQRLRQVASAIQTSDEELHALLLSSRPLWIAGIGFASLLAILFLMIFKPF